MHKIVAVAILALLVPVASLASISRAEEGDPTPVPAPTASSEPNAKSVKPVVVDTDAAIDDWLALLYLLQRPDIDIRAVTVSGMGEAHCAAGVPNVLALLALAARTDIPVACGRETPLQCNHEFPTAWRQGMDSMLGISLPPSPSQPSTLTAVELLTQTVQESPQKITLITLGPLTNVAETLQSSPNLSDRLEMIYVMGGAVDVDGNINVPDYESDNMVAEWNVYIDPEAAQIVLDSAAPTTLVALDATNHAPITMDFYTRLEADATTPEAEFVYHALTKMRDRIGTGEYFF